MRLFSEGVGLVGGGTPVPARSHRAKDNSMLSVGLPMLEAVVKDWITRRERHLMDVEQPGGRGEAGFKKIG